MTTNLKQNPTVNKVHANKFKLIIPKIDIISDLFRDYANNYLELSIKGTVAAGLQLQAIETPIFGHKPVKVTGAGYRLEEIPIDFLIDGNFVNYFMLWKWLEKIYNLKTATSPVIEEGEIPYEDFEILGLDNYNNPVVKFKYRGGFITSLSDVTVGYDNSERLEAKATFAYDDYTVELTNFSDS